MDYGRDDAVLMAAAVDYAGLLSGGQWVKPLPRHVVHPPRPYWVVKPKVAFTAADLLFTELERATERTHLPLFITQEPRLVLLCNCGWTRFASDVWDTPLRERHLLEVHLRACGVDSEDAVKVAASLAPTWLDSLHDLVSTAEAMLL